MSKSKTPTRARGVKALTVNVARLGEALKSRGHDLKQSELLEVAAFAYGLRDGNALAAAQKDGRLDLAKPVLQERVALADGTTLLVLRHESESKAFGISPSLLASVSPAVLAAPSGRLFDLTGLDHADSLPSEDTEGTVTLEIHTASIEHKHGTNTYAALSAAALDAKVAEYCRDNWNEISSDEPPSADEMSDADLISRYFDEVHEEFLDTSTEKVEVPRVEIHEILASSQGKASEKSHAPTRGRDPLSREAWRAEVANEATDLGYGEWYLRQPKPKGPLQTTGTRQFLIDDMRREALLESLPESHPLRIETEQLSAQMADNMPYGTAILSVDGARIPDLLDRLNARLKFHGPTDHENFGRKIAIEDLIGQIEGIEKPVLLTDETGDPINGSAALFEKLGLDYEVSGGEFWPLSQAESRYTEEMEISFRIGTLYTGSTGLYRGRKYLTPVIKIYHDHDDDGDNVQNAEYIETRLVPELKPRIGALGGFIHTDIDAGDDYHMIVLAIPFDAAAKCPDMNAWAERLAGILEGHPETVFVNVLDGTPIEQRVHRPCEPGDTVSIQDHGRRTIKGRVITVEGEALPSPVMKPHPDGMDKGFVIAATHTVAIRVESIDGVIQSESRLPVLETEADLPQWMTRDQAANLKVGQKLISLTEGSGDVETDDDSDIDFIEREYGVGDWLTVESVEVVPGPQGLAVTVSSRNGVVNTFDEADDGGKYPFLKPSV